LEDTDQTVWQHGKVDADENTTCARYDSFDFAGDSQLHLDVANDNYVNQGPTSSSSLEVACQFLGENLATGKTAVASSVIKHYRGPENVSKTNNN